MKKPRIVIDGVFRTCDFCGMSMTRALVLDGDSCCSHGCLHQLSLVRSWEGENLVSVADQILKRVVPGEHLDLRAEDFHINITDKMIHESAKFLHRLGYIQYNGLKED